MAPHFINKFMIDQRGINELPKEKNGINENDNS